MIVGLIELTKLKNDFREPIATIFRMTVVQARYDHP
jgi:hypothetical protein